MLAATLWKTGELFSVYLASERPNTAKSFNEVWDSNQCFFWHPNKRQTIKTEQAFVEGKNHCGTFWGQRGGGGVWCFRVKTANTCIQNSPKQIFGSDWVNSIHLHHFWPNLHFMAARAVELYQVEAFPWTRRIESFHMHFIYMISPPLIMCFLTANFTWLNKMYSELTLKCNSNCAYGGPSSSDLNWLSLRV